MDFASLVHQSPMLQCPDFWLQCPSDTEDQLRAQVMLANRVYRYGVYKGHNENEYIGIASHSIPYAWKQAAAYGAPVSHFPAYTF